MSRLQNKPTTPVIQPEIQEQINRLREQVAHAEAHDQYDTAHHTALARLLAEIAPVEKESHDGE
jgi:hypothetical protein